MNEHDQFHTEPEVGHGFELPSQDAPPARKRGHPVVAWFIILLVVGFMMLLHALPQPRDPKSDDDSIGTVLALLQGRYLVGATDLLGANPQFAVQAHALDIGPVDRRFRYITLVGELESAAKASNSLDRLERRLAEQRVALSPQQARAHDILERLYTDYERGRLDAPSVTRAERAFLRERLDWSGELALAPAGGPDPAARQAVLQTARKTTVTILAAVVLGLLAGLGGFVGLVIFLILAATGQIQSAFGNRSSVGGIYVETFAIYLLLFVLLSIGAALLPFKENRILIECLAASLSLLALAWPVLRGVPWRQVRSDIGWTGGRSRWLEPFIGLFSYPMVIVPLVIGFLVMLALMVIVSMGQGPVDPHNEFTIEASPAHPIVGMVRDASPWVFVQLFFLAGVVAPIIEETMFRGVLYRHLRDATFLAGTFGSALASATLSSFVFAAVHPQGFVAVPVLMVLAFLFCVLREWRGTVLAGMAAHSFSNSIIFTVLYLTIS